jgi:GTP pyrophosphokinase
MLLIEQVVSYAGDSAWPLLERALALTETIHAGKMCDQERPYVEHVIAVAELLAQWRAPVDVIVAGLLHDVTERRYTVQPALEAVRAAFGDQIAIRIEAIAQLNRVGLPQLVDESDSLLYDLDTEATRLPVIVRMLNRDLIAAVIKIADRIEKLSSKCALPEEHGRRYAMAAMNVFVPIANRLGMWSAKRDLEDNAFRLLHPEDFATIMAQYGEDKRLAAAQAVLQSAASQFRLAGVSAEPKLLPISFYSLHRRLLQADRAIPPHLLTPLLIVTDSIDACYAALRVLHQLWPPLTGQVWDYIANPKSNQYRAIHTRVRYEPGAVVTAIIRTHEAHLVAERGITAGWAGVSEHLLPKPPEWRDPPAHRIVVFTPDGDLRELPTNAIAVDFAYAIHPQIGHQCVGAVVNGETVAPERSLRTGDVVEIVTSPTSVGPREDWLNKVKSKKARSEIRRWLLSQGQDSVAQQGWNLLDAKLREIGATLTTADTASRVRDVATEMGYNSARDLQMALALGRLTPTTVLARMQQTAQDHGTQIPRAILVPLTFAHLPRRLAKCCRPLAPDPIVGYVTQRDEVVIHRATCRTVRQLKPLLSVEWQTRPWQAAAQIRVSADDRAGLVRDVAMAVTESNIGMSHFHADRLEDGSARITLDLDQTTSEQTHALLERLRMTDSVRHLDWGNTAPDRRLDPSHYFQIPYTLSPVIGRRFFGREAEFIRLADYLRDPAPGKAILLWGPRRIGKTSLLRQLEQILTGGIYLPVFIDMQSLSGQDTAVFLHTVARGLAAAVAHQDVIVPKFNRLRHDPLGYFRSFVDALRRCESRHIVLILDEFQVLAGLRAEKASLADSFAYLRSLITGGSQISFIFSGGGVLDTLRQQVGASSLLNVTHTQKVDCLSPHEARRLIVEPAQHLSYDDQVVDEMLALTAGHPYYLQMLCGELALSAYNSGGTRVSQGHLEGALADWLPAQEEHHFNHLWGADSAISRQVQQYNKLFLTAIATTAPDTEGWATFEALGEALEPAHLQGQALWQGLQMLFKMDTLEFDSETRYRLKVGLCQRWISGNYSIGRILRELL